MAYQLFRLPKAVGLDSAVRALSGAKAYFYETGTTTPQDTYSDAELTTPHAHPVVADASGVFPPIYLDPALKYKVTLTDSADVLVYTVDPVNDQSLSAEIIGRALYPRTAAETAAGVTPTDYSYPPGVVLRYGTNATPGTTDMTAIIQTALNSGLKRIYAPAGTYLLTDPLDIPDGVELYGDGHDTVFIMSGSSDPKIISLDGKSHVTIRDIRFVPQNTGTNRYAVYLDTCTHVKVIGCRVLGQTNASAIGMLDCDECVIDDLYFDGGASLHGYGVYMVGCKGCKVSNSTAYRCNFGFVITGHDINDEGGLPPTARTNQEAFGNIVHGCNVRSSSGHAFDVNSATGNVFSACTAEDYAGSSTHPAFQAKHPTGDDTRQNVFSGCTVRNYPSGFYMQQGSNCVFVGCTAIGVDGFGFGLNDSLNSQFHACAVYEFGEYGIWISSSSDRNIFNGIYMETSTATAVGISVGVTLNGCDGNMFDNIRMRGTLAYAIDIGASNNNTRFSYNVYVNDQAIRDLSAATYWPVVVKTSEISAASTGNANGGHLQRGMVIAVVRAVVTADITGTPQVQCGRVGDNDAVATAQNVTGSAGSSTVLTQVSQLLDANTVMQGRVSTAGSGGTVFFQYEGLPRL